MTEKPEIVSPEPYKEGEPRTVRQWMALRLADSDLADDLARKDFFKEYDWMLINNEHFMDFLKTYFIESYLSEAFKEYFAQFCDPDKIYYQDDPNLTKLAHEAFHCLYHRLLLSVEV